LPIVAKLKCLFEEFEVLFRSMFYCFRMSIEGSDT
jgi:hypothetical protein